MTATNLNLISISSYELDISLPKNTVYSVKLIYVSNLLFVKFITIYDLSIFMTLYIFATWYGFKISNDLVKVIKGLNDFLL